MLDSNTLQEAWGSGTQGGERGSRKPSFLSQLSFVSCMTSDKSSFELYSPHLKSLACSPRTNQRTSFSYRRVYTLFIAQAPWTPSPTSSAPRERGRILSVDRGAWLSEKYSSGVPFAQHSCPWFLESLHPSFPPRCSHLSYGTPAQGSALWSRASAGMDSHAQHRGITAPGR